MATNRATIELTAKDKTKGAFRSFNKSVKGVTSSVFSMQGAIVSLVGIGGFGALIKGSLAVGDSLGKTADKLGTTTKALGGLQHAAGLTSVSTKTLDTSMQRFTRRLSEANEGYGAGVKGLDALGLSAEHLLTLPLDQQMGKVADAMNGLTSQADRVRVAASLFDQEGVNLVNTLALGSDGLREAAKEAEAFGTALSRADAAKIEAANDAIFRVQQAIRGVALRITTELAPFIKVVADRFSDMAKESGGWGTSIVNAVERVAIGFAHLSNVVNGVKIVIGAIKFAFAKAFELMAKGFNNIPFFGGRYEMAVDIAIANTERMRLALQTLSHSGVDIDQVKNQFMQVREQAQVEAELIAEQRLVNQESERMAVAEHYQQLVKLDSDKTEQLVKNKKKELTALEKFNAKSWDNQVKQVSGSLVSMTQGVTQHSKTMFKLNKAAAIANAIVNTAQGVTNALAAYPPPLSFAMAAAQLAAGVAQVSAIKSTSFGGGSSPSVAASGAGSAPVATTPAVSPTDANGTASAPQITINFQSEGRYSKDEIRDLLDQINTELGDGATLGPA